VTFGQLMLAFYVQGHFWNNTQCTTMCLWKTSVLF